MNTNQQDLVHPAVAENFPNLASFVGNQISLPVDLYQRRLGKPRSSWISTEGLELPGPSSMLERVVILTTIGLVNRIGGILFRG
jgi:hypothetical protein